MPVSEPTPLPRVLLILVGDASQGMIVRDQSGDFRAISATTEIISTLRNHKESEQTEWLAFEWCFISFHDWARVRYPRAPLDQFDPDTATIAEFEASDLGKDTGGTRIHTGLDLAAEVASDFRDDASIDGVKATVFVFLFSTGECLDPAATLAAATRLKELGATISTAGYSADGEDLLTECASRPEWYFPMFEADTDVVDQGGSTPIVAEDSPGDRHDAEPDQPAPVRTAQRPNASAGRSEADETPEDPIADRLAYIFCADASRSMTEPLNSDPYSHSKAAEVGRRIFRALRQFSSEPAGRSKHVGCVTFGSKAEVRTPLMPADRFDPRVTGPTHLEPTAGGVETGPTRIHTGLDLASVMLRDFIVETAEGLANGAFIYLLTDGICSDPDETIAAALRLKEAGVLIAGSALSPEGEELVRACISGPEFYRALY